MSNPFKSSKVLAPRRRESVKKVRRRSQAVAGPDNPEGHSMLDKCATKGCPRRFKYFGVGLLFVAPPKTRANADAPPEFFWLCERCARRDTEQNLKRLPVVVGPAARRTA